MMMMTSASGGGGGADLGKNKLVNNNCNIIAPIIYCYLLQIIDKYWSDLEVLQ
jgi:hypothetical protein